MSVEWVYVGVEEEWSERIKRGIIDGIDWGIVIRRVYMMFYLM